MWALPAAMALAAPAETGAQPVDYDKLEQLFGEPITTSVTGKPQKASDVAASLVILTQDDIRRSGADTLPDILRFVTGLDVRTYGIQDSEVAIRGYDQPWNPRLLVMVNGRQIYLDDYSYVAWSTLPIPLDEIRQIEIVKGPNSALFGFNAASGVINIITTNPLTDHTGAVSVRTGSQNLAEASVYGSGHIGDTAALRLSANGFRAREFGSGGIDAFSAPGRLTPRNGALDGEASWLVAPGIEVTAEASLVDSQTGTTSPEAAVSGTSYQIDAVRLGASLATRLGQVSLDFYRNRVRVNYANPIEDVGVADTVYVAKASDLVKLSAAHTIRLGVEYRTNAASSGSIGGTIGYQVYAADAMWDWQITRSLSVVNAVRVDRLSLHLNGTTPAGSGLTPGQYNGVAFTVPSFNSGLVWQPTERDTFRITAARGLQMPSLLAYTFHIYVPQTDASFQGSPALSPTSVWNAEIGYDRAMPRWNSVLRTSVYHQTNDNLSTSSLEIPVGLQAQTPGRVQSANIGNSQEAGFETAVKGSSVSGWRWGASYSFARITTGHGRYFTAPGLDYARGSPRHTVILSGGYTVGPWEVDATCRWQSGFTDAKLDAAISAVPVRIGDYATINARVGYRVTKSLTLSATVQQLNAARLTETAAPPVERRFIVAATARF